jgi:Protein of unknown function (DUF3017)
VAPWVRRLAIPVRDDVTAPAASPGARARAKAQRAAEERDRAPWYVRELALTVGLAGVVIGLIMVVVQYRWRVGVVGIGADMLLLAVARLVLPTRRVGVLAVRSRWFDVLTLLVLGVAVVGLTLAVPIPPS